MRAVVPAAGLGSRFLPASRALAKELLPLGCKPLIHHVLDEVEMAGFTSAVIVVSPAKTSIRSYFEPDPVLERQLRDRGDEDALRRLREAAAIARRLRLGFVEQRQPTGLANAVMLGCAGADGEPCGVLLPDDVIRGGEHWDRLFALHADTGGACFCVRTVPKEAVHRFGVAVCEPAGQERLRVVELIEKPAPGQAPSQLVVFGRYIVTEAVLHALGRLAGDGSHRGELQLTDGFAAVLARPPGVLAVPFHGDHFDNGTPEDHARSAARYVGPSAKST
jgi:UTP--glucose-1-phosphate uridylyltransferase